MTGGHTEAALPSLLLIKGLTSRVLTLQNRVSLEMRRKESRFFHPGCPICWHHGTPIAFQPKQKAQSSVWI